MSTSSHGRGGRGYRYYRLIATSDTGTPKIEHVNFWLTGARHYRNSDKVVHLYNYLLTGAAAAVRTTHNDVEPTLASMMMLSPTPILSDPSRSLRR